MNKITTGYLYKGQPLQTEEFYNIIEKYSKHINCLKSGETFQTNHLTKEISEFHYANGGKKELYDKAVFKALKKLNDSKPGLIKQVKKGLYVFTTSNKIVKNIVTAKPTTKAKVKIAHPIAKNVFGSGNFFIYVLDYKGGICKIGKTINIHTRFKTLASGLATMPEYFIEVRLKDESTMHKYETIIHNILKIKKLEFQDKNKGGKEFFKVSPKEIHPIITSINKIIF